MSLARSSRAVPEAAEPVSASFGWWLPSPDALGRWRALIELQIKAAEESYRLAASHAERRQQALTQFMETLWPTSAGARPQEETPHV